MSGRIRDAASLGDVTPDMLRETFGGWRVFESGGVWWAIRGGKVAEGGPESLLRVAIGDRRPAGLAEKLCLQEWLDNLGPGELAAVWRDVALPAAAVAGAV